MCTSILIEIEWKRKTQRKVSTAIWRVLSPWLPIPQAASVNANLVAVIRSLPGV